MNHEVKPSRKQDVHSKPRGKICSSSKLPGLENRQSWGTPRLKLNLRFDVGLGQRSSGLYFNITEAF